MMPWHIAVLIPARDEEQLLPRCLRSIERARALLPSGVTSDVIVVADSSCDRTYQIAQQMLEGHGCVIATDLGCVGSARILAANMALERYAGPTNHCWLANTDADCEVPEGWLLDQLLLAQRGVAAVAGIVDVDSFAEHEAQVSRLFRETYLIHADGTHPHVHGANLGIRADAYVEAGGWAHLQTAEDHDLWHRLGASGYTRLSDAGLQVITSGRRVGRAPLGFAGALAAHNEVVL
jgi:glycosyltransferase involved in cell wall biosynthesis